MSKSIPKIKPEESRFGLREALAYSGLMDCDKCHRITRERDLIIGVCEFCAYSKGEDAEAPLCAMGPAVQLGLF